MSRSAAINLENKFVLGLVTDATGLNFPENAATETFNCIFSEDARVTRRLGFDYEDGFVTHALTLGNSIVSEYTWKNVAGLGTITFVVLQVGSTIFFYEVDDNGGLSSGRKSFTVDLGNLRVSGAPSVDGQPCQFASGSGFLFVTHPYCEPFFVSYNPGNEDIETDSITIKIRDFTGLDDGLGITERPQGAVGESHKYNLQNQGWDVDPPSAFVDDLINEFNSLTGSYPSNADVWWLYKLVNTSTSSGAQIEVWDPTKKSYSTRGNSPAPKGFYILDAFRQDRSEASRISGIGVVTSGYFRPSTVAFFAGRVFYSGVNTQGYSSRIYFSQIIEDETQFGLCYQQNDPTSEDTFDLLATDGGTILIPDAGKIVRLVPVQDQLIVFASNGIWAISGSQGLGFKATDYAVRQISSVKTTGASSFVDVGGSPMWWTEDGIFTLSAQSGLGTVSVQSLTDKKIKTFFDEIPVDCRNFAKGAFNPLTRIVQWVYRSETATTVPERNCYDRILNFNTLTGSFYPWSIPNDTVYVSGIVANGGVGTIREEATVTNDLGETVTDGTSAVVTVDTVSSRALSTTFRYVTLSPSGASHRVCFAQEKNGDYTDWAVAATAEGYSSYFITGYKVHGQAVKDFQSNYVHIYMDTETDASCYVQGVWSFANSGNSGKFSPKQQAYSPRPFRDVQSRRLKIRGQGRALQLKFTSEPGKPFTVLGWALFETGNGTP